MHDERAVAARLMCGAPASAGRRHGEDKGAKWGTARQTGQKQTLWITQWAWNTRLRATRGRSCHVQSSCLHWTVRAELTLTHKGKEELVRLSMLFISFLRGFFFVVALPRYLTHLGCPVLENQIKVHHYISKTPSNTTTFHFLSLNCCTLISKTSEWDLFNASVLSFCVSDF